MYGANGTNYAFYNDAVTANENDIEDDNNSFNYDLFPGKLPSYEEDQNDGIQLQYDPFSSLNCTFITKVTQRNI